jgi:hypothetical protein
MTWFFEPKNHHTYYAPFLHCKITNAIRNFKYLFGSVIFGE